MAATSRAYPRLLGYLWRYRRMLLVSVLATTVVGITAPALPIVMEHVVERFEHGMFTHIGYVSLLIVILFAFRGIAQFIAQVSMGWIHQQLLMELRNALVAHLVYLPATYYDQHNTGKITSRVLHEPGESIYATVNGFFILVRDALIVLSLLGYMLYSNWRLALIVFAFVPAVIAAIYYFSKRLRRMSQGVQDAMAELTRVLFEIVDGHHVVRSHGAQGYEIKRFKDATAQLRRFDYKFAVARAASAPIAQLLVAISLAVLIYVVGQQIAAGTLSIGTFVGFSTTVVMLFSPIKNLTSVNASLQRGIAAAANIFKLLDEAPEQDTGRQHLAYCRGRLTFEQLCFSYPGHPRPVFENLQLEIAAGEMIAVVGLSGSGKSTLAALSARCYPITSGCIRLDGIDVRDISLASLRQNIVVVNQDTVLLDDTVLANITYGQCPPFDREQIERAICNAAAAQFIEALPQQIDTRIGSRGVRLSGGQRQRLALVRALLRDAPVLILDESTSALDNETERYILHLLTKLRSRRTTIIIAHRLSTIAHADRIVVIDQGEIVGIGTHEALSQHNRLYASLYNLEISKTAEQHDHSLSTKPPLTDERSTVV